jgi:hypothetical protein
MDNQMVKLWVMDQITKITRKMDMGHILPVVGKAKIELLRDFYETFQLDRVTVDVTYHDQI